MKELYRFRQFLAENVIKENLSEGLFSKKSKLYEPKGISQIHNYVNDRQVTDLESKIKSKEISPKQLSGINSVMMAIEGFLKANSGIIENERNGIKFLIYPTGKAGGLTDNKLDLYINLPQKGKPNNLRTNPEETLKMMKIFIDDYLKKQKGIDVASAKVKKSNDTTAYDVTVPITFKESVAEGEFKENTLEYLIDKYGQKMIDFTIKVDQLTGDEVNDIEYLEDRIKTHLEEPAIRQKYLAEGKLYENEYFDAYHEAGDKLENHPNYNKLVSILKDKGFEPDGTPYSDGTGRRDVHGVWDVFKSYTTEPGSRGTTLTKANAKDINDALRQAGIEDIKATPSNSYSFRLKVNNLAEGRLLKEEIDYSSIKDEMKKIYDIDVDLDTIKDFVTSYNDSEGMDVFDTTEREDFYLYLKDLAEGKQLNEFVGKELEDRNEPLYDELVPGSGKADTVEGEMLRAINRIVYRYYNDGDEYHTGYGTETAGPAHSYLVNAPHPIRYEVTTLFKNGTNYEQTIKDVLDRILDHIESRRGKYTPNSEDMYDYEPEFEDDEFEEEDYGYDYDDDYDEFDNKEQF